MDDACAPAPRGRLLAGLSGGAESLVCARAVSDGASALFIARDVISASYIAEEIKFFAPHLAVSLFPDWELLPYDDMQPPADLVSRRLAVLRDLQSGASGLVVAPASAVLGPLPPTEFIAARAFSLVCGAKKSRAGLLSQLAHGGYIRCETVRAPGEFAVCGGQIDLYPAGASEPYRLVFVGDEIEEIRAFDPDTQRSTRALEAVEMLPAREFLLDEEFAGRFRARMLARFDADSAAADICRMVRRGVAPPGASFYLPLFFERRANLLDYLPAHAALFMHSDIPAAIAEFWRGARARYDALRFEGRLLLPPAELFMSAAEFESARKRFRVCEFAAADCELPDIALGLRADNPAAKLAAFVRAFTGKTIIAADSDARRDALFAALTRAGLAPVKADSFAAANKAAVMQRVPALVVAALRGGFIFDEEKPNGGKAALISEAELYGAPSPPKARRESNNALRASGGLAEIAEIRPGDAVVHRNHGVGIYRGLKTIASGGARAEFIQLEYAGGDKLLVPIAHLDLISRYHGGGDGGEITPHKLGGAKWGRQKAAAKAKARDAAARILEIHARRVNAPGRGFPVDESALRLFSQRAGFEETADQARAIGEVVRDMKSATKMDRLVCGDVGFGKTEIALRAAFIAANAKRQTAVLAPTTLLAEQHHRVFTERFAGLPMRIAKLTRADSARETIAAIANGDADIVIGTHKLLSKSVRWRDLGLVVIDEEHRFGVRHKEHFKALRADADILALSATPIPRTLALALDGARDFSAIATAPRARLAVKTVVARLSAALAEEAIARELLRGGQVFFIHNDIATIEEAAEDLRAWAPRARVGIAHGRMPPATLEDAMRRFARRELDILAATTIIESGLHIANANTLIVNRADRMGLAQLHQLRGRVGRSHRQAYAYFLSPAGVDKLPSDAAARLAAISEMSALGSGFWIARRDLEIRGAGEVLGEKQSGEIAAVGLEMYQSLLAAAVKALRKKSPDDDDAKTGDLAADLESAIDLGAPALLPEDFCGGVGERLRLYRRLSACPDDAALFRMKEELEDRFGKLPPPAALLIEAHRLRLRARASGAASVAARGEGVVISFVSNPPFADALHKAIADGAARPLSGDRIKLSQPPPPDPFARARIAEEFLDDLRG